MTRPASWSVHRRLVLLGLALGIAGSVALGVLMSIWFLAPLPVLAAAVYAVVLGMTPSRFFDALDDGGSGSGTQLPY